MKGRVDATRTFEGRELNTAYLFGLFARVGLDSDMVTVLGVPMSYQIQHFAANQNVVAVSAIVFFHFSIINTTLPLEIDIWAMWDNDGAVTQYDATFRWFDYLFETIMDGVTFRFGLTSRIEAAGFLHRSLVHSICQTHAKYCHDGDEQYESTTACEEILDGRRLGSSYELGADTILCRMVHQGMVPIRPGVHCPHIGPTGGEMCVDDYTYLTKVSEPVFAQRFVAFGY